MELLFEFPPSIPTLLVFFITIFLVLKIIFKVGERKRANLPPGPPRLPFIGNLHQLAVSLPHRRLHQLAKKYGPVMHLQLGEVSTIVISSPEAAKDVMRVHDVVFANRPSLLLGQVLFYGCTDLAFSPYGDYWRKLRNICMSELLSPKRVQSFRHIREEVMTTCIKSIAEKSGSTIDLTALVFHMVNSIVARTALGIKGKDQDAFAKTIEEAIHVASESGAADTFPSVKLIELITGIRKKLEKMFQKSDKMLEDIVNDHRAKRNLRKGNNEDEEQDLVDVLLKFEDDANSNFSLTANNIKAVLLVNVLTLAFVFILAVIIIVKEATQSKDVWSAGVDTSAGAIEWAMSEMLKSPHVMQKAQAEVRQVYQGKGTVDESNLHKLEYLKLVIKETFRLHPPLPLLLPRESSDRCEIFGYNIPPKTRAIINAWAIGRDPEVWTDPNRFDPERFLESSIDYKGSSYELIPFGAGRRMCPGWSYGLAIVEIQLAMFLYHFDWKLPDGMRPEDLDMSETFGLSAKRKHVLHVIPIPHPSSFISQMV